MLYVFSRHPTLALILFSDSLSFSLLLSSQISVAITHVTDDPSQIHNDEIILSTVQRVYVCCIDLHTGIINEVPRWKHWVKLIWADLSIYMVSTLQMNETGGPGPSSTHIQTN